MDCVPECATTWGGDSPEMRRRGADHQRPVCGHGDGGTRQSWVADAAAAVGRWLSASACRSPISNRSSCALRRAGLVESARGRSGGYRLARAAARISVADIMAAVEEETHFTRCHDETRGCVATSVASRRALEALGEQIDGFLSSVTLQDVTRRHSGRQAGSADPNECVEWPRRARSYLDYNATAP